MRRCRAAGNWAVSRRAMQRSLGSGLPPARGYLLNRLSKPSRYRFLRHRTRRSHASMSSARQPGRSTDAPAPQSLGGSLLSNPNMDSSLVIARSRRTARAGLRITTLPPVAVTRSDNSRSTCSPLESMKLTPAMIEFDLAVASGSGTSANASTNVRHVQASISPVTSQPCGDSGDVYTGPAQLHNISLHMKWTRIHCADIVEYLSLVSLPPHNCCEVRLPMRWDGGRRHLSRRPLSGLSATRYRAGCEETTARAAQSLRRAAGRIHAVRDI